MNGWVAAWCDAPHHTLADMAKALPGTPPTRPTTGEPPFFASQFAQDGNLAVGLAGRLDCRDELASALRLSLSAAARLSDGELLAMAWRQFPDRLWPMLQGDFAAIITVGRERCWLIRDPIGAVPLYYAHTDAGILAATAVKPLFVTGHIKPAPDRQGLADYVLGRFALSDPTRTCFAEVQALPPGCTLEIDGRGHRLRNYWDFDLPAVIHGASADDYAGLVREAFTRSVARRLRDARPAGVFVSGGVDSSSILAVADHLCKKGTVAAPRVQGVTFTSLPGSPADELAYIDILERSLGTKVSRVPTSVAMNLQQDGLHLVKQSEAPLIDTLWHTSQRGFGALKQAGVGVVLSGLFGDQVCHSTGYWHDLLGRGHWLTLSQHLRNVDRWHAPGEGRHLRRGFWRAVARSQIPASMRPLLRTLWHRWRRPLRQSPWYTKEFLAQIHAPAATPYREQRGSHQAAQLYFQARSKYHVNCLEWDHKLAAQHDLTMTYPFLDRDFLRTLMAIPGHQVAAGGVPRGLFRRAMANLLPEPIRWRRDKADFTDYDLQFVREQAGPMRQLLQGPLLAQRWGLVDEAVSALLPDDEALAAARDCRHAWEMTDVAALELWLHAFTMDAPANH